MAASDKRVWQYLDLSPEGTVPKVQVVYNSFLSRDTISPITHSTPMPPPLPYIMLSYSIAVQALLLELLLGSGAWLGSMPDRASIHEETINTNIEDILKIVNGLLSEVAHIQHGFYHYHDQCEAYGFTAVGYEVHDVGHWKPMLDYVGDASTEPVIQQIPNIQQLPERAALPVFNSAQNGDDCDEAETNEVPYRAVLLVRLC